MKKLLNPRLNTKEVIVLDDDSSDENPLKAVKEPSLIDKKLSTIFMELRGELLKEEQQKETEVSYSKDQLLIDEDIPKEVDTQENPSIPDISTDLLEEDADIFWNLNIPWMPTNV